MENGTAVRRITVREGYAVLLTAELSLSVPQAYARLTDFTERRGGMLFRRLSREEGERARAEYLAAESNAERARRRTRRLRVAARAQPTESALCRVLLTAELDGTVLRTEEWVWNLVEETLLPPGQIRRLTRQTDKKRRTSTKN